MNRIILALTGLMIFIPLPTNAQPGPALMPVPASVKYQEGRLPVKETFSIAVAGHRDGRLTAGIERMARRLESRSGLTLARGLAALPAGASLLIECQGPGQAIPNLSEDESYTLTVTSTQAALRAPTVVGALRGLETFLQLLSGDKGGYFIPAVTIEDRPRFPWRGLMIDIGRHWQPMEVLKRNMDGMAAVKLNVLHLHITEDQGFRIESKKFPKLHQLGSDGNYYTQDQMREIIEYARVRGIRVVPEFDMPGHTTSWFVGHPELASAPGPYQIERKWGIFEPVLDPTNEQLYKVLDGFLGEMAALFPDDYLHIGGDEVEAKHWQENPRIAAFIKEKGLKDNHGLQGYFNRRLLEILIKHKKKMIGWDEIFQPDLPKDIVIHSWRGPESLAAAAQKGYQGILSNGYYIDLMHPTRAHYLNDPIPDNSPLTPEQQKLVLGGEATMWSEWVSPETIDSRIWPRMAAIAERLWSPRQVKDVSDMYRRLANIAVQLEEVGLLHERNQSTMIRRLAGSVTDDSVLLNIKKFIGAVEPVKGYKRGTMQNATQFTPLTRVVDAAVADSQLARSFGELTDHWLYEQNYRQGAVAAEIDRYLNDWIVAAGSVRFASLESPLLAEVEPLADQLQKACKLGIEAALMLRNDAPVPAEWATERLGELDTLAKPAVALELVMIQPIREMVVAVAEKEKRRTMSPDDWKAYVKKSATPKKR